MCGVLCVVRAVSPPKPYCSKVSCVVPLMNTSHLRITAARSSGMSLVKSICLPVEGCMKPKVLA